MLRRSVVNWVLVVLGLALLAVVIWGDVTDDRFIGAVVVATLIGTLIGANLAWPRHPDLMVEYRSEAGVNVAPISAEPIDVVLRNRGAGDAEAMRILFGSLGGMVEGEGIERQRAIGGSVHVWWRGDTMLLGAGESHVIATINRKGGGWVLSPDPEWRATARHMKPRRGTITVTHQRPDEHGP